MLISISLIVAALAGLVWLSELIQFMIEDVQRYRARRKHRKSCKVPGPFNPPADFFMPFSKCPSCRTEALHWIEAPATYNLADERLMIVLYQDNRPALALPPNPVLAVGTKLGARIVDKVDRAHQANKGRELARQRMANNPDVHRRCRECGHWWGQNVQPYANLMETA